MKNIIKAILPALPAIAFFSACSDQGDVVDSFINEVNNRPVVHSLPYTLKTADYAAISTTALKDAGENAANRTLAQAVKSTNTLNSFALPQTYIPQVLKLRYPALGLESAIQVTYAYTPDYLARLTATAPTTYADPATPPAPGTVWEQTTEGEMIVRTDAIALVASDYAAMGLTGLTVAQAPNYLPQFLAGKYPYAQEGKRMAVLFSGGRDEYIFTDSRWVPSTVGAPVTEQYVNDGSKWIFDPTVNYSMVATDHKLVIDHMLADPEWSGFVNQQYRNEEFYYGFGSRYNNVSFRLSSRNSYTADTELHALTTNEEKVALLWNRLEQKGMPLFLQLKFPNAVVITQGVQQYYNVTVAVYYPEGVTNKTSIYTMRYKVLTAGAAGVAPTFGFVSTELVR